MATAKQKPLRQPKAPVGTPAEQQTAARQRIQQADPIGFLIAVMQGQPLPILGVDGEITGYERIDAVGRAAAADRLLRRVLPELRAVEMTTGADGVVFRIAAPFALPGSARGGELEAQMTTGDLATGLRQLAAQQATEEEGDDQ